MDRDVHISLPARKRCWRELEFWLLLALACAIYLPGLTRLSIRGEESRRAQVAAEILRTGDWIVPRQQGEIYLSRPPLGSWPIAALASWRGEMDVLSVRLPAALATIATCLLLYLYARRWLTPLGALTAGAAFGSMAQVLELGGLAETESTLTLLVAASLLCWHAGYVSATRSAWPWVVGYALAALAGLAKGPQGPVYFVAVTTVYLWALRDFREWFSWRHALGILTFAVVLGAWQIPFTLRTDWASTYAIWSHNASDRFAESSWQPFLTHLALYPFEVAACMLPWSLLLLAYAYPGVRRRLDHTAPLVRFLCIALLVTFPSCWFAATARGRYFMPLYPCAAVLIGVAVDRIVLLAQPARLGYALQRFLWPFAAALPLAAAAVVVAGALAGSNVQPLQAATDPPAMLFAFTVVTLLAGWLIARAARDITPTRVRWAILSIAGFVGFLHSGPITNIRVAQSQDTDSQVAQLKQLLPLDAQRELVSLGLVHHLFAYYYAEPIRALAPEAFEQTSYDWEYFCLHQIGDAPLDLPFDWTPVAVVSCDRARLARPHEKVIVGRRLTGSSQTAGRGDDHARK
ncbi:MAG: glycosyltransferase family 39 protein [Planctomycetia bacterium]|nr:glycosyltransferase family 39 protein [Planctomycetia bacterium]